MKAIVCTRYGSPDVLKLKEVKKPTPRNNEVLVKVYATAVTASDCIVRGFKVPVQFWIPMALAVGFPKPRQPILGLVLAGEVESTGKEVKTFSKGDQVFGWDRFAFGTYAEYKCVPENGMLAKKPTNMSYEEAAAILYGGLLALPFLRKGNIHARQNILIYGASGAIGTSAVQLAKYYGARVTGVCSTENFELVKSLGTDNVIDYTKEDFTKKGDLYDLILNAVGKRKANLQCKKALTPRGKHITVDDFHPKHHIEDLIFLKELAEAGMIKPVIDRCYSLEQMTEAHRYVETGHKKGNVVITIQNENT